MPRERTVVEPEPADDVILDDTVCSICNAEFLDSEDLNLHVRHVHLDKTNKKTFCEFCSILFPSLIEFVIHLRNVHLSSLKCCLYCNKAFVDEDLLRKHQTKHYSFVKKSMYSCSNCQVIFNNLVELERHEVDNHSDITDGMYLQHCMPELSSVLNMNAKKFINCTDEIICICCYCGYTNSTKNLDDYVDHLKLQDCRSYACNECAMVFARRRGLSRHITMSCKSIHEKATIVCEGCNKTFNLKVVYNKHKRDCNIFECPVCNDTFKNIDEFSQHQTASHPLSVRITRCKYCRKEYVGKVALKKHIERIHQDAHLYKYVCPYCTDYVAFKHPQKLFAHYTNHKGLLPYHCKICDTKFKFRKLFTLHIKLIHSSIGSVEHDDKYNVSFTAPKPEGAVDKKTTNSGKNTKPHNEVKNIEHQVSSTTGKRQGYKKSTDDQNITEDYMNHTETDVTETDVEKEREARASKRKLNFKSKEKTNSYSENKSSDDENLLIVKKKIKALKSKKIRANNLYRRRIVIADNKKRFVCNVCKKNCNSAERYHRHMLLHFKRDPKQCVKCSSVFKTQKDLIDHQQLEHQTSKLTDTLKSMCEMKKNKDIMPPNVLNVELDKSILFQRTIKKVVLNESHDKVTIKEVGNKKDNLSAKNFLESFAPDFTSGAKIMQISNRVTIKSVREGAKQFPGIVMKKFKPFKPIIGKPTLSMPVAFKNSNKEKCIVSFKMVNDTEPSTKMNFFQMETDHDYLEYDNQEPTFDGFYEEEVDTYEKEVVIKDESEIPEVDEEKQEEVAEDKPKVLEKTFPKIVIPNYSQTHKKIRIAHLTQEAPFFKIVKIDDVVHGAEQEYKIAAGSQNPLDSLNPVTSQNSVESDNPVVLPSGKKLVTTNPLAHLLDVEKINTNKNKYYKPKLTNYADLIAEGLHHLENGTGHYKPKIKPKKNGGKPKKPEETPQEPVEPEKPVVLPSGLKLVTSNPLAHLVDTQKIKINRNKYYKPKLTNYADLIAKGLQNLESGTGHYRPRPKVKRSK